MGAEGVGVVTVEGGAPGVNRRARQKQHTKATLQAAHADDACAHTRACAMCQGSDGEGAEKVPKLVIKVLSTKGG